MVEEIIELKYKQKLGVCKLKKVDIVHVLFFANREKY